MATDGVTGRSAVAVVYRARSVITGDPVRPRAGALLVRDGRIGGLGEAADLVRLAGGPEAAEIVDLGGATIVPGFIDAHCHVSMLAYLLSGAGCSPEAAPDIPAILERLAATEPGPEGWLTGSGYAEYQLREGRGPTRDDLDRAVPDTPCVVFHRSLHLCVVNGAGLRRLGLADGDPIDPLVGRDPAGRLDGRLLEGRMFELMSANLRARIEALDGAGRAALVRTAADHLAALGITSCADAATDAGAFVALREAERRGELPIRVTAMFTHPESAWLRAAGMTTGFGSERLQIGAIKLFADGGLSSRTAAVDAPYVVPAGATGMLWHEPDGLAAIVRECHEAGFQVAVHAQGERALRMTLAALEPACRGGNPARHRIEHGGMLRADLRATAARLGVLVVSQPGFLSALGDGYLEALGAKRCAYLYPYASLEREGVVLAGSSDAPVIGASPLVAIRDAILRRTDGGVTLAPDEALTAGQALALYGSRAAFAGWHESAVGSLVPGMLADFVVLDGDPTQIAAEEIARLRVLRTVVGGMTAFEASPPAA